MIPTCALCQINPADKKGSHLVPHFLMKTVDNVDNKPGRDLELGFEIGRGHVKGYFGTSVLPERLEPVYGDISDDDIKDARSSMIVDHLLCKACEDHLARLESKYSQTLKIQSDDPYVSTDDSFLAMNFWLSVFWRLSVSDNKAFKLAKTHEEQLRVLIDEGVQTNDVDQYLKHFDELIGTLKYRILRCIGYTDKNSAFVYLNNANDQPYCMLVGEFACFLYMEEREENALDHQTFLGLEAIVAKAKLNSYQSGEEILPVDFEVFKESCRQVVDMWKDEFLKDITEMCDAVHIKFIGIGEMPRAIKGEIIDAIANDDNSLGRKYTLIAIVDAITKILIKYEPYRSIAERM